MRSKQHKSGRSVIPIGRLPARSAMTCRAIIVKTGAGVIRIVGSGDIRLVARDTSVWRVRVACSMAGYASRCRMRPGQYKSSRTVIEIARFPSSGRMTGTAIVVEVVLLMVGISRRSEVSLMTIETEARCAYISAGMTGNAGQRSVRAG